MADAGIGEAMLISAAIGGGVGAASGAASGGGDKIWQNALIGAGLGAVGGGISAGMGGAGAGAAGGVEGGIAGGEVGGMAGGMGGGLEAGSLAGSTATSIPGIGMTPGAAMPGTIPGVTPGVVGAGSPGITSLGYGGGMGLGAPGGFTPGATLGGSGQAFGSFGGASVAPVEAAPSAAPVWNLGTAGGATGEVGTYGSQMAGNEVLKEATKEVGKQAAQDVTGEAAKEVAKKTAEKTFLQEYGPMLAISGGTLGVGALLKADQNKYGTPEEESYTGSLSKFKYDPSTFKPTYATPNVYTARYADGGIASLNPNAQFNLAGRSDTMFPQSQMDKTQYATPSQLPTSAQVLASDYDSRTNPYTGTESPIGMARGGIASLGSYSDGGQMLRGPGDGVSDSIPASIGGKQPARLADGEFVVPARAVSELGNGSTDAGAKQLYAMLNRIEKKRKRGKGLAYQANPKKMMPA